MGLVRNSLAKPRPLDLQTSDHEAEVLNRVGGGQPVTLSNLQLWRARCDDPKDAVVLDRLFASLFEAPLRASDVDITGRGVGPVSEASGLALSSFRTVDGEPPELTDMRERMPEGLWGQEQTLPAFLTARADGLSTTRRTSSLLLLGGDVGHGKNEALQAYEELLAQPAKRKKQDPIPAKRIDLDLSRATDDDIGQLFGADDAPLNEGTLEAAAKNGNVLIVLRNPVNLAATAPELTAKLNDLFNATHDHSKALHFVVDFDGQTAQSDFGQAFGSPAVRQLSASAQFGQLDARAMLKYADQLLPKLLEGSRLANTRLVLDEEARACLGRALATPEEPLDDLEPRLQQLLLSHAHTQTSFDPKRSVLKFSVAPDLKADPAALQQLLTDLHQPLADLTAGRALFSPLEVATNPALTDADVDLAWSQAVSSLKRLREGMVPSAGRLKLERTIDAMARQTDSARRYGWADRVTPRQYAAFRDAAAEVEGELADWMAGCGENAPLEELRPFSVAANELKSLHEALAPLAGDPHPAPVAGDAVVQWFASVEGSDA